MKILVTGGAGYVGSVTARHLLKLGHSVRVLDCLMHGGGALAGLYPEDNFEFIRGDIRNAVDVGKALEGMEAVAHLAAIVGDPACSRQPDLAKAINLEASLNLFNESRRRDIKRFVFASTCSNYGRMKDPSQYIDENSQLAPVSLYAETKVAVEETLLAGSSHESLAPTVLRFATIFGLSPRMRFDLTVNEFTLELFTKRKVVVYGDQFWRPYIHVRDAARAIALVLGAPKEKVARNVFNVGDTNENYQKGALAELIRLEIGLDKAAVEYRQKQEDPRDYRVSFAKVQGGLGFTISRTVKTGVQEIVNAINSGVITDFDNPRYRN